MVAAFPVLILSEYLMQVISGEYGKDPYEEDTPEEQS